MPTTPTPAIANPASATASCAATPGTCVLSTAMNQPSTAIISPEILIARSPFLTGAPRSTGAHFGRRPGRRLGVAALGNLAMFQRLDLMQSDQRGDQEADAGQGKYETQVCESGHQKREADHE